MCPRAATTGRLGVPMTTSNTAVTSRARRRRLVCGALARATDGKRRSRGGRRAHCCATVREAGSADEDDQMRWVALGSILFFFLRDERKIVRSESDVSCGRAVTSPNLGRCAGAYHSPFFIRGRCSYVIGDSARAIPFPHQRSRYFPAKQKRENKIEAGSIPIFKKSTPSIRKYLSSK